jgi:ribosomal protein S12 methylthiotransferase accessory factor
MALRGMGPAGAAEEGAAIGEHAALPEETAAFFDPDGTVPAGSLGAPALSGRAELEAVVDRVGRAGLEPHAARLTTRGLDAIGFEAVRVLVPGTQPLFTDEPYFGERARTVPRGLGYEPRLDRRYHPFP